ncbi:MAG: Spy/CpxP family protein refolding chaperone [Geothrix sp.]|uniref:Spy/CpxP family protein refolding chaperone n=1 Tax=Geothrix sp. TaxID=1962974 RepID=UPI003BAE5A03
MTSHPLRFAALAVALLTLGTALSAQGPGFGPGHGRGPGFGEGRGLRGLNLSEAQQTQVKAIHDKHQAAFQAKGETAQAAHKVLRGAMADATSNADALKVLHDKASAARFDLMLEHRAVRQEILPLLTAEQKVLFEKAPMGMGPRGGRGRGPGLGRPAPDAPQ